MTPQELAQQAQMAAEAARQSALKAEAYADAAATIAATATTNVTGYTIDPFVFRLSIFVLAVFVGYYVVWSVTPALHTPLMSVTNAISSVIVVGALAAAAAGGTGVGENDGSTLFSKVLGGVAIALAAVNIFGGFLVTQRMLAMYQKKK